MNIQKEIRRDETLEAVNSVGDHLFASAIEVRRQVAAAADANPETPIVVFTSMRRCGDVLFAAVTDVTPVDDELLEFVAYANADLVAMEVVDSPTPFSPPFTLYIRKGGRWRVKTGYRLTTPPDADTTWIPNDPAAPCYRLVRGRLKVVPMPVLSRAA